MLSTEAAGSASSLGSGGDQRFRNARRRRLWYTVRNPKKTLALTNDQLLLGQKKSNQLQCYCFHYHSYSFGWRHKIQLACGRGASRALHPAGRAAVKTLTVLVDYSNSNVRARLDVTTREGAYDQSGFGV